MHHDETWRRQMQEAMSRLGLSDPSLTNAILSEVDAALAAPERESAIGGEVLPLFDDEVAPARPPHVRVQVGPPRTTSMAVGHIALRAHPDVWQTLWHADHPAAYRVLCDQGELHLTVDDVLIARLEEGQSSDVCGAVIRVRACGEEDVRGRYARMPSR